MARVFATAIAASAAAAPDLSGYTYEQWLNEYGIAENSAEAEATFNANLRKIKHFNAESTEMWLAPNQFMAMDEKTFAAHVKGRSRGPMFLGAAQKHDLTFGDLPDSKDWREEGNVVTPAKDQGGCGSCWAFSAVESLESHLAITTGEDVQTLSPQQIVSCSPNPQHCGGTGGCDGSTQPLAFKYTETAGITTEANYPYQGVTGTCKTSKIDPVAFNDGFVELTTNNYTELVTAVATKGPISISIAASGFKFQFYGGGVLSDCNDYVMDHAVQLVGYGTDNGKDYWLVRNSWGDWGEQGYVRIARYGEGKEPCGTDSEPQDGDACQGDTDPRTYCGECGILSSSSYPTGLKKAGPSPAPSPTPSPTPTPTPSPTPAPTPTPTPSPTSATKLLIVNASNVVGGDETGQLLEVDLATKATRTVVNGLESNLEWIRTSIVCGDKWYSLPTTFAVGADLATVDLTTGTYEGRQALNFLPFGLKCGEREGELLTVSGTGSPPQFSLVKLNVADASTEVIGTFPDVRWGGWLSIFHFSETELQASFSVKAKLSSAVKGGEVYRMDLKTGEITFHKQVKSCRGCPAVPYHLQHLGGDTEGHGVFAEEEGKADLSFCKVDYSGKDVKVSDCKKDTEKSWWAIGRQPVQCDGDKLNYFASVGGRGPGYEPVFGADMDTGDLTDAVHLQGPYAEEEPEYYIGSMACSPAGAVVV